MKLLIVESPSKCNTIKKYLGPGYEVKASYGHFRNLAKKNMGIDINNNFQPTYEEDKNKKKYIIELKQAAQKADTIYLAADDDREGEAIAWHCAQVLKLNVNTTPRIIFHEITKEALQKAIAKPTKINMDTVRSQQARQIADKLIGFELSPVLWKHIQYGLSAGRVQSVVTLLIVEKEQEITNFQSNGFYAVEGSFIATGKEKSIQIATTYSRQLESYEESKELLELCTTKDTTFKITDKTTSIRERNPSPPFITSTLQQEAGTKLGLSAKQTMSVAQKLYEKGKITYMRTDSTILSKHIIEEIKGYVTNTYGEDYLKVRQYAKKVKGSQDAHECIRPTHIEELEVGKEFSSIENRLYQMIWKRTVACQMSAQKIEETLIKIQGEYPKDNKTINQYTKDYFKGTFQKELFPGFTVVYHYKGEDESDDGDSDSDKNKDNKGYYDWVIKSLSVGMLVQYSQITATEKFTQPPPRYTEASLIKILEKKGIGRPSTYASMVTLVQERGYVNKESRPGIKFKTKVLTIDNTTANGNIQEEEKTTTSRAEKNKLVPTETGKMVTNFLVKEFPNVMNYDFTANMEEQLDVISQGKGIWYEVVRNYYEAIHPKVLELCSKAGIGEKEKDKHKRHLGQNPKNGENIYLILGKFGPCLELGDDPNNKKFAALHTGTNKGFEDITLLDALDSIQFPKKLGKHGNTNIVLKHGPYGYYLEITNPEDKFKSRISLPKNDTSNTSDKDSNEEEAVDPLNFSLKDAIELIEKNKNTSNESKSFKDGTIKVLNGKFGPYLKTPKGNISLRFKSQEEIDNLTLTEIEKIIANYQPKTIGNGKKAAGKAPAKAAGKAPAKAAGKASAKAAGKASAKAAGKASAKAPAKSSIKPKIIPKATPKIVPKIEKKSNCLL